MASSRSWRDRLAPLAGLSRAQWLLLLRARLWMNLASASLRVAGFERTRRLLQPRPRHDRGAGHPADLAPAGIARVVELAARAGLQRHTCLPRSLVLQRLLAQRGHDATLRLGVRKEGERIAAHAWVEVDGETVGEAADVEERFARLLPADPG